ncbi:hypothetical protein [Chryseobacterium lathyri]|uniref:hypothetical protein n=1 Tax=Chryseobacterium lathyri TaxID=395933 RepID=UPI00278473F9|nr:hypothetical protein [Chryseobacterium lathyri]MDQ0067815.1 superfamily II helicase [Chryseobacterium lathyri]
MKTMIRTGLLISIMSFYSCAKEDCVSCIAESKAGKIVETRMACDENSEYLVGFVNGFKQKHQEMSGDSVVVYCAYSQ